MSLGYLNDKQCSLKTYNKYHNFFKDVVYCLGEGHVEDDLEIRCNKNQDNLLLVIFPPQSADVYQIAHLWEH